MSLANLISKKRSEKTDVFHFYCVACRQQRFIRPPARLNEPKYFLQILLTTLALSAVFYPWFKLKGLMLIVPISIVFEVFSRLKYRTELICNVCHFDPVLYKVDPVKAARQVKDVWIKKYEEKGLPIPPPRAQKRLKIRPKNSNQLNEL